MNVDEYLAWAEAQPGRFELHAGTVYAMAPERAGHAKVKFAVQIALRDSITRAGLPCHMLPDGMTVRVDKHTAHEPDALVYCGPEILSSSVEVPEPVVVVEVLSPSTRQIDASAKLDYFNLPSLQHYLIVDPEKPFVIHHARGEGDLIATRILRDGVLHFDPPGMVLAVADFYPARSADSTDRSG